MKVRLFVILALGACWWTAPAQATTLVRLSVEQLSQAATDVVRGRVVRQESRWNPSHTQIVTLTTIAVEDRFKGGAPTTIVVEQVGGTVSNFHLYVSGTVTFRPQTSYALFLEPLAPEYSRYLLVGMVQGAYRIYRHATTQQERIILPLGELPLGSGQGVSGAGGTMPLNEFRQVLSGAMKAPLVVPRGTSIPVVIQSTESRGVGRVRVLGRTTSEVYPSGSLVIPAGSFIEGTARLVTRVPAAGFGAQAAREWRIEWTEVEIGGARVPIRSTSDEPAGWTLRGRTLVVNVR